MQNFLKKKIFFSNWMNIFIFIILRALDVMYSIHTAQKKLDN